MSLLDRLKLNLGIKGHDNDDLLEELLIRAENHYWRYKGPHAIRTESLPPEWNDWQIDAAIELYNRIGIEGQTGNSENGTNRSYDSADLSNALKRQITPVFGNGRFV